jgi:hypothetical protein
MDKNNFEKLSIYKQGDVSVLVNSTIGEMVKEQFNLTQVLAFVEMLKERLGQLDVVPRSMIESRNVAFCGPTEVDPREDNVTKCPTASEQASLEG